MDLIVENMGKSRKEAEQDFQKSDTYAFLWLAKRNIENAHPIILYRMFNSELKAKPKAEFPNEQSLDTFIGIQAMSYNERYFNRIHKGFGQVQDTLESYFD